MLRKRDFLPATRPHLMWSETHKVYRAVARNGQDSVNPDGELLLDSLHVVLFGLRKVRMNESPVGSLVSGAFVSKRKRNLSPPFRLARKLQATCKHEVRGQHLPDDRVWLLRGRPHGPQEWHPIYTL